MNFARYFYQLKVNHKFLNHQALLVLDNFEKYIHSVVNTYGVVVKKLNNGDLDANLRANNKVTAIDLNAGYVICDDNGELRILNVVNQTVSFNALSDGITYKVYIVPKNSNYETGTVTLTNGTDQVNLAGGDFQEKLYSYESIVIDGSILGNNGVYKIYKVVGSTLAQLTEVFQGATESGLKWKISGDLGKETPSASDLLYNYDDYDIIITPNEITGFKIVEFVLTGGNISSFVDKRGVNLYSQKNLSEPTADEVLKGFLNDITTIEEKAQAASVNGRSKDFISRGVKSGGTMSVDTDGITLTVQTLVAYNQSGKRIQTIRTGLNLDTYVGTGEIITGNNFLFVDYSSPSSYRWIWRQTQVPGGDEVLLAQIAYDASLRPKYVITKLYEEPTAFNVTSVVFDGKNIADFKDGQVYYDKTQGILFYGVQDPIKSKINKIEIIGFPRLDTILNDTVASIAKSERLRFSLWIDTGKDSWFYFNGVQGPTMVGYNFKVPKFKPGYMALTTPIPSTYKKYDYPIDRYPEQGATYGNILTFENILSAPGNNTFPENSTVGVYFAGSGANRTVQLVVNGTIVSQTNMQDDSLNAPVNKLYVAEVEIQYTDSIITVPPIVPVNTTESES